MLFQDTKFWKHYTKFSKIVHDSSMRSTVDGYIFYKIITQFNFKQFLEIGFFEGMTAGLMAEISSANAIIDCVDPTPNTDIYNQLYSEFNNKVALHKIKSVEFAFDKQYDFILIDGDTQYDVKKNDINLSIKSMTVDGILIVNQYSVDSVHQAMKDSIMQSELVPFMQTNQSLFFSRPSNDRSNFLDYELPKYANNFIRFYNILVNEYTVLRVDSLPIFTDRLDFFNLALIEYNS